MGARPGLVDVHTHLLPAAYVHALRASAEHDSTLARAADYVARVVPGAMPPQCGANLFGNLTQRLPALDAAGIAFQVVGAGSLLAFPPSTLERSRLVQLWNNSVHAECLTAPDRFAMFAALPLPDVRACVEEVRRVGQRSTIAGYGITSHVHGIPLDDTSWAPLYQEFDELGAVVFVHPHGFSAQGFLDRELDIDLGTQFEDTLAVLRLVRSGTLEEYPRIRWVIAHLGGTLPFVLERLDEHWERDRTHRKLRDFPSRSLGTIKLDTAGHGRRSTEFAFDVLGAERIVFGTDFPMVHADSLSRHAQTVRAAADALPGRLNVLLDSGWGLLDRLQ